MKPLKKNIQKLVLEAGCDEAGRGCLAGPVFAAAVVLPVKFKLPGLNDSKLLSEEKRMELRSLIRQQALAFSVASVSVEEIDQVNILNASILAMHKALQSLALRPGLLLIDGNRFHAFEEIPHRCIINGDATYASIAAASILAKTERDDYMRKLDEQFPHYCWKKNKGYGTKDHRNAIMEFGACEHHRTSFRLLPDDTTESVNKGL